ncbi:SpaA isopeptide-forming pilin-related protein [Ligilactobacillus aviarius]|uniref:SpaA isopeptide-forming pilin-related protein n=1 Tax=Ligilactobacillus aviarius TaxID=1606 RepID=UPI0024B92E26|nr:SpaA isopeptide-forming pilin-related protein [Ligilactobacillus aviarius]
MNKFKSKFLRAFMVIASIFLMIAPAFTSNNVGAIKAADVTGQLVDSITTNIGYATPGQTVTFNLHFSGKKNYPVKAGDTIHVSFPQSSSTGAGIKGIPTSQALIYNNPNNPNDPDNGVDMGTITVTSTGVTITFNQQAASLKTISGGDFSFQGKVVAQSGTQPDHVNQWPDGGNLPIPYISVGQNAPSLPATSGVGTGTPNIVEPTGQIMKRGAIDSNGNVDWEVHGVIGNPGTTTVTDEAQDGQTLVPGTFKIVFFGQFGAAGELNWMSQNVQYGDTGNTSLPNVSAVGSLSETSNGFTLNINDQSVINELSMIAKLNNESSELNNGDFETIAYTITYQTKLGQNEKHTQWTNTAVQKNPDGTSTNTATGVIANQWHNDIWGTQPKDGVVLSKQTSDGEGLPGATFELSGNGQDQKVTSNDAGTIEFTGLINGDTYKIKEIKAPDGYQINNELIEVKIVNDKPVIVINGKETQNNVIVDKAVQTSSSSTISSSKKSSSSSSSSTISSSKKSSSSSSSSMISSSTSTLSSKGLGSSSSTMSSSSLVIPSVKSSSLVTPTSSSQLIPSIAKSEVPSKMVPSRIAPSVNSTSTQQSVPVASKPSVVVPSVASTYTPSTTKTVPVTKPSVSSTPAPVKPSTDEQPLIPSPVATASSSMFQQPSAVENSAVKVASSQVVANGKKNNSSKVGKGQGSLPQTGEAAASTIVVLGVVLIAISGVMIIKKNKG